MGARHQGGGRDGELTAFRIVATQAQNRENDMPKDFTIGLVVPFAMVAALIANAFLLGSPWYTALFCLQALFYSMALLGTVFQLRPKTLLLPFYFCMINAATFFGLYHALTSRRRMAWK